MNPLQYITINNTQKAFKLYIQLINGMMIMILP